MTSTARRGQRPAARHKQIRRGEKEQSRWLERLEPGRNGQALRVGGPRAGDAGKKSPATPVAGLRRRGDCSLSTARTVAPVAVRHTFLRAPTPIRSSRAPRRPRLACARRCERYGSTNGDPPDATRGASAIAGDGASERVREGSRSRPSGARSAPPSDPPSDALSLSPGLAPASAPRRCRFDRLLPGPPRGSPPPRPAGPGGRRARRRPSRG